MKKQTWLSQWLNDKLPYDFELSVDAGRTLGPAAVGSQILIMSVASVSFKH